MCLLIRTADHSLVAYWVLADRLEKALVNLAAVVSYLQAIAESYLQAIDVIGWVHQMVAQNSYLA